MSEPNEVLINSHIGIGCPDENQTDQKSFTKIEKNMKSIFTGILGPAMRYTGFITKHNIINDDSIKIHNKMICYW